MNRRPTGATSRRWFGDWRSSTSTVPRSMIDAVVADCVRRAGNRIVEHAPDGRVTELSG
jgi:hypothetical protein